MALGTTGMSTTIVGNYIGMSSGNVGELCTKAKVGGVMTQKPTNNYVSAFRIVENENAEIWATHILQGELIPAAEPFWNMFAANSPGEWFKKGGYSAGYQGTIALRLKDYITSNTQPFDYSLGSFRGHDLTDEAAYVPARSIIIVINDANILTKVIQDLYIYIGKYKFEDIFSQPIFGFDLYRNAYPTTLGTAAANYIGGGETTIDKSTFRTNYPTGLFSNQVTISTANWQTGDYISVAPYMRETGTSSQLDKHYFSTVLAKNPKIDVTLEDHTAPTFGGFQYWVFNGTSWVRYPEGTAANTVTTISSTVTYGYRIGVTFRMNALSTQANDNKTLEYSVDGGNTWEYDASLNFIALASQNVNITTNVLAQYAKQYMIRVREIPYGVTPPLE